MKSFLYFVFFFFLFTACKKEENLTAKAIRNGVFETVLDDSDVSSVAIRNDSIQIETYNNKKDTFAISWVSNFEYVLQKKHPKTALDSTAFHVKINGIYKNSYSFTAYYIGSNFKQKGKAIKIKN